MHVPHYYFVNGASWKALEEDASNAGMHQCVADDEDMQQRFTCNLSSMSIFTAKTNTPMVSHFHTQGSSVLHLPAGFVVLPKMQWVMLAALLHLADCDLDKREKLHI